MTAGNNINLVTIYLSTARQFGRFMSEVLTSVSGVGSMVLSGAVAVKDFAAALDGLLACDLDSLDAVDLGLVLDFDHATHTDHGNVDDHAGCDAYDQASGLTGSTGLSRLAGPDAVGQAEQARHLALIGLIREVEVQRRRLAALDARLIAALQTAGTPAALGARSTAGLLHDALVITPAHARARTLAARDTSPRASLTGQPLEPTYPHIAAAQQQGTIDPAQARVITRLLETLPSAVTAEFGEAIEAELVTHATTLDAGELHQAAERLRAHYDPDGTLADDDTQQRHRDLRLRQRRDGTGELTARLTDEALAVW